MKKFWLTRFIVVVYCVSTVIGCRTTKQQPIVEKNNDTNDRQKRGMGLDVSTTTDIPTPGSNEAEQVSTTVVSEVSDNMYVSDTKSNQNTTNILREIESNKDATSDGGVTDPLPSSDEEDVDEIKSRKARQKSYKCYCEEASYRSDCLKKCQSAKQFVKDDSDQDLSTEMTEDPLEAYTKNVNFDQRVILGSRYPQSSLYSNPQTKISKNRLFPVYPQNPHLQYAISYPRRIYNGIPLIKQNYLASALKKPGSKGTYIPSTIGRNFADIQECIKLYGQTVCVIAPTQSPVSNSETTTTVDFMTENPIGKSINEIDESCADNNENQNIKSTGYPNQLIYQTNTISPLYEINYPSIHDPKLTSMMKLDKLYRVGSNPPKLLNYYVGNKQQPYANHFNYGKKIFLNNGHNKNLQKSFNGKYYLNKNNINNAQAMSPNNNGMEKQLYYIQTLGVTTPRPITQRPVYATKYPFPTTTPSYAYLDEYDNSRNVYSKEIVSSKKSEGDSQERGISNYQNLLEQTTISPLLQPNYVIDQQKSDYQSRYEENVVTSSLQKKFEKINENNYNLAKADNNFAHGLSRSNAEKEKKLLFSNGYNYNSDVKVASSEINSHTSNYVSNSIPESQSINWTTEGVFDIENTLLPTSEDRDSSEIVTSIRKEYDNDNSNPVSFSYDPQHNHQAIYENVNSYKSGSPESKDNELYYYSNEALKHEKYKNNGRPQAQFDYSNYPQSMSRIINEANEQYTNNQYPQYRLGNRLKQYPNNNICDNNNKNNIHIQTPATPMHNYGVNSEFHTDSPNTKLNNFNDYVAKTLIPDPTSYVDRNTPIYTTISISQTTPPTLPYNHKVEATKNQGNYYTKTYGYDVRNGRPPSNYEYQDRSNTRLPLQSSNLKKQDIVGHSEQFDNAQILNVKSNSKSASNIFASKTNSNLSQGTAKSITTLENLEDYGPIIQSQRKYPSTLDEQKIRLEMFNDTETLFRGLEQVILDNYDPVLSEENTEESIKSSVPNESTQIKGSKKIAEKILSGDFDGYIEENIQERGQAAVSGTELNELYEKGSAGTENSIQSVDDIPATVRENIDYEPTTQATIVNNETPQQTINELLVQNTIRKVINNFVPGKAEDLMKHYENKNAKEIVGATVSDLHPEIVGAPVISNLFNIPEIENMIVDVAGGLINSIANIGFGSLVNNIRKSFRHVVNNDIPRPSPTLKPFTVEEHHIQNGQWVTEQISLLGSSKTDEIKSLPREVFDKIKSILGQSRLSEEEAAQPIVQNLIVKAVKHSLNKERKVVQEPAIRKAYKIIVKPTRGKSSPSYNATPSSKAKKVKIPKPEDATASSGSYKLAPIISIKENNFNDGSWKESQKLLVNPNMKETSTGFDENAKKALQKQLEKVKKIKVVSKEKEDRFTGISNVNFKTSSEHEYEYEDENEDKGEDQYSITESNAKEKVSLNNVNDETLDRQPIKYYSPNDRILEYIKTHQNAVYPSFSTTAEIIGQTNEYDMTTPMSSIKDRHPSLLYEPEVTENSMIQNTDLKQSNRNQLNLLFESPKDSLKPESETINNDGRYLGQTNKFFGDPLTRYSPQSVSNLQTYMGRLIPVDDKASQAKDLNDLQNSNLVYVGDGVRLPLTIRKMPDGTFALTLSDEGCKKFLQKQCPCCLPDNGNGFIIREQKSIKDVPEWIISNNIPESSTENINSNTESYTELQRQYKDKEPYEGTYTSTEYLDAHISPPFENQKESEEEIKIAPSKVKHNSEKNIYARIRRESEEQKEAVQGERFAMREKFTENNIETSMENKDKALLVNNSSNEKSSQKDGDKTESQIDDDESESFETQFDYEQEEPYDLGLIPRMIGPYRYQQLYANENADALRNMLYMMQSSDSSEEE